MNRFLTAALITVVMLAAMAVSTEAQKRNKNGKNVPDKPYAISALPDTEDKPAFDETALVKKYRYKSIEYFPSWDESTRSFENNKDVYYFNSWKLEGERGCHNNALDVVSSDGILFIQRGTAAIRYLTVYGTHRNSSGGYRCYQQNRTEIIDNATGKTVWQSSTFKN